MANGPQSNEPLPDWIIKRQHEKAEQDQNAEEDRREQLEAAQLVQTGSEKFWTQLLARLALNVGAFPELPDDELVGSVSPFGSGPELSCHIQVNRQSVRRGPALSRMNLFYQPGGHRIRRWYQDREMADISLQPSRQGIVAVVDGSSPMTAAELGDDIIRNMADKVRYPAQS